MGTMEDLGSGLPLEVWDRAEERRKLVGEALAAWNERVLTEGVWAYLVRKTRRPDRRAPLYIERFLLWLVRQGRRWPDLKADDLKAYLAEIREHGFPGEGKGPLSPVTVERARRAFRHLFGFLEWAGHPMPPHVEFPERDFAHERMLSPMSEEEWESLWAAASTFSPAHWRPLIQVLLVLTGELGLSLKEAIPLWRDDLREEVLLVRGRKLREVPLTPKAREVLTAWLPTRDYLASHQPIPHPHLLVSPSPGKGRGRPIPYTEATWLFRELSRYAGYREADKAGKSRNALVGRLRWRAIRNFLKAGYPRDKVAYWTGMRSLVFLRSEP